MIFALLIGVIPSRAQSDDFYSYFKYSRLSVRKLSLEREEKIIGFKLKMKGAYVYSVPIIPHDWTLSVGNFTHSDLPWNTVAVGAAGHDSSAVREDYFNNFVVIGGYKPVTGTPEMFPRFDLELEITTEIDHVERKTLLRPKDLIYTPFKMDRGF